MGLPSSAQHDILVNARPSRVDVLVLPTAFCIDVVLFLAVSIQTSSHDLLITRYIDLEVDLKAISKRYVQAKTL